MNLQDTYTGSVEHHKKYAAYITPAVKHIVLTRIGLPRILASNDAWLNDIPLKEWDNLPSQPQPDRSLSAKVCLYKAAAVELGRENLIFARFFEVTGEIL